MSAKTPNSWHARFITVFLDEKCQYDLYGRRQFSVYSLTEFLKATHVLLINNILKKKKKKHTQFSEQLKLTVKCTDEVFCTSNVLGSSLVHFGEVHRCFDFIHRRFSVQVNIFCNTGKNLYWLELEDDCSRDRAHGFLVKKSYCCWCNHSCFILSQEQLRTGS